MSFVKLKQNEQSGTGNLQVQSQKHEKSDEKHDVCEINDADAVLYPSESEIKKCSRGIKKQYSTLGEDIQYHNC